MKFTVKKCTATDENVWLVKLEDAPESTQCTTVATERDLRMIVNKLLGALGE